MIRFLAILLLLSGPALAQNSQCANRPAGDATNACANTRFVGTATTNLLSANNTWIGTNDFSAQTSFTLAPKFLSLSGPMIANGSSAASVGTLSGNTTKLMTGAGSFTNGNLAKFDANGNVIDGGTAGLGSVTSVGLSLPAIFSVSGSPVTTSGTLSGSLATQSANTVWAGPTSGAAATPTFRAVTCADLPTGSRCLLNTLTASSSATLQDTTSFTSTYSSYIIEIENLVPGTSGATCQMNIYNGSTYPTTGYVGYMFQTTVGGSSGTASTTYIPCDASAQLSTSAPGINAHITVGKLTNSAKHTFINQSTTTSSSQPVSVGYGGGWYDTSGAVSGLQFKPSSGVWSSGTVSIYGIK